MPQIGSKSAYVFNCSAQGYPIPTFKWFKDQKVYESANINTSFTTSSITWNQFTTNDNGVYTCQATNIIKSVSNSQAVFLYCKIHHIYHKKFNFSDYVLLYRKLKLYTLKITSSVIRI